MELGSPPCNPDLRRHGREAACSLA